MRRRALDTFLVPAVIDAVETLGPRIRSIVLTGSSISELDWTPGQHVRLQVGRQSSAVDWLIGALRTYSVWRRESQRLELIIFDLGGGPGSQWAASARVGDEVRLLKPQGRLTLVDEAPYHLFIGDETASVAFGPMLRALTQPSLAYGVIEVDSPQEQLPLDGDIIFNYRHGAPAAASQALLRSVQELTLPTEPGAAYLAGEAKTIQLLRQHLVEDRGWPRRSILMKPFWTPGKRGLD